MITEADAIRAYPELAQLATFRDAGWHFLPITDDKEQLDGLVGTRHWPGHTDALWIHDRTDTPGQPGAPTLILARSLLDEPTQLWRGDSSVRSQ